MPEEEAEKRNGGFILDRGETEAWSLHFYHCPFEPFPEASSCSSLETLGFMAKCIMVWPLAFLTLLGVSPLESVVALTP